MMESLISLSQMTRTTTINELKANNIPYIVLITIRLLEELLHPMQCRDIHIAEPGLIAFAGKRVIQNC